MKKWLIGLGLMASTVAPVLAVVSCGSKGKPETNKEKHVFKDSTDLINLGGKESKWSELQKLYKSVDHEGKNFNDKIERSDFTDEEREKLKAFVKSYDSSKTAAAVLAYIVSTMDESQYVVAVNGLNLKDKGYLDFKKAHPDADNKEYFKSMLEKSSIDPDEMIRTAMEKFSGVDTRYNHGIVSLAATYDPKTKTLTKGAVWSTATNMMGGKIFAEYLIKKAGNKIVDNNDASQLEAEKAQVNNILGDNK